MELVDGEDLSQRIGTVKVLDFGLAKLAEQSAAGGTNPSP